jgi:hypothetical protein
MTEGADPSTALGMTEGADPSTALGMTGKCGSLASLGMTGTVIPSERRESRDLHLPPRPDPVASGSFARSAFASFDAPYAHGA